MASYSAPINVGLVDDHPIVRCGLTDLISEESDMRVTSEASNAKEALTVAEEKSPDIMLVDISLGNDNGLTLISDLQRKCPALKILVLSMHDEALYAERVLKAGARGYITKGTGTNHVVKAIRCVMQGDVYLSPRMHEQLWGNPDGAATEHCQKTPVSELTNRELEVFDLIGRGMTTREIAGHLDRSIKTIETFRARLKRKLKLKDAVALVRYATRWVCE